MLEFYQILIPALGLFTGSFANVLIRRIPRKENWIKTRSHCPICGEVLAFYDMIPVLSWVFLYGRCRFCRLTIPIRYPAVELLNALAWLICVLVFGLVPFLPVSLLLSTCLLIVSFIDMDTGEIPDGIIIFILSLGIIWNTYAFITRQGILLRNIIGFFTLSLILLLVAIMSNGGMGGGDIKLSAVCGLILGWQDMLVAICIAAVFGTIIMLPSLISGKRSAKSHIPFAPFLSLGIFISMCFSDFIIKAYLVIFMPG